VVGVIGRNGAGKSTLLKILSRITEPSEGYADLHGRIGSLLEVGTGFHPELTGRENVYLNGAILGMKRAEIDRKFDEIVAFSGVEAFLDTPVKRYSSGMQVRLAFAVAAHMEPEILVVDEVLAVGDAEFQKKCLGKMQDISKGGRTVLFVSHNTTAVQALCDTGILMDHGRVVRSGPIGEVIDEYQGSLRDRLRASGPASGELGPALMVRGLEAIPAAVESGGAMRLQFQIVPATNTTVRDLALVISSDRDMRVAVLDLRRGGLSQTSVGREPVDFDIRLDHLPLVEGEYRLGFYVVTGEYQGNYPEIASFTVTAVPLQGGPAPYPPRHRGFLELEFSAETRAAGMAPI
jgi:lipopolysaccharide transport system ATP-binding protein